MELKDVDRLEAAYKFQPKLTPKLDALKGDFTQETINEIVLWKVNRYAELPDEILAIINQIPRDKDFKPDDSELLNLLNGMLAVSGIQLPMASTILRFRNPQVFQIIDQRVYRFLYDNQRTLPVSPKAEVYIQYLKDLRKRCESDWRIPFDKADRIIYQADKEHNSEPLKRY